MFFFFSSRRRHTRYWRDWSSDVCSSDPLAAPAQAQLKSVEIIAPAGPGGGYDQLARATQEVLEGQGLASGVQVVNVPGAGGTIGLAQFVTGKKRGNSLLVAGLGMIGAIKINQAPVTLDQVTPLARLIGEYQPMVVAPDSPLQTLDDLVRKFKADPGSDRKSTRLNSSHANISYAVFCLNKKKNTKHD